MRSVICAALVAMAMGCDDDSSEAGGHEHAHETDHVAAGCAHFEFGPFIEVATAGEAETIRKPHHRYDITLESGEGALVYHPEAAATYLLMLTSDLPLVIADAEGNIVEALSVERSPHSCEAAAVVHEVALEAKAYTLTLGPSDEAMVGLVVHLPIDGHAHDSDGGHEGHGSDGGHEGHDSDGGHETDGGHGHEADGGHGHEEDGGHGHEEDGGHGHEADGGHEVPDVGGDHPEDSVEHCECLLINCHDPFHELYGVDDAEAIAACLVATNPLPRAGAPAETGDSVECRQHHCEAALEMMGDAELCAAALGTNAVCAD